MEESIPLSTYHGAQSVTSSQPAARNKTFLSRTRGMCVRIVRARVLQDMWKDTKTVLVYVWDHQRIFWLHAVPMLMPYMGSILPILLLIAEHYNGAGFSYCAPGGDFDYTGVSYNQWNLEHLFQITYGWGHYTFAQAKAIDVVWDIMVGRGGQLVLSAITFMVFSKSLNRLLEAQGASVSYNTFRTIVFEQPSLMSAARFGKDLKPQLGWRARCSMIWFVLASIYVVAFPTFLSAMTGYSPNVRAYFDTGSSKVPLSSPGYFRRAVYHIKGADRILGLNLSESYLVGSRGYGYYPELERDYAECLKSSDDPKHRTFECGLAFGISEYIENNQLRMSNSTSGYLIVSYNKSTTTYSIEPYRTLDIEVFNTNKDPIYPQRFIQGLSTGNQSNISSLPYMYTTESGTRAYDSTELNNNGTCDSLSSYMWGFSFLLLFIFAIVTGVWVLGMYIMWDDAFWNSRLDRGGRKMGFYRGVADISNAMWKDMLWEPSELASESKIKEMLAKQRNGGRIKLEELDRNQLPVSRIHEFRSWTQGVPSLCGWTKTWTLLHTLWFVVFCSIGGTMMGVVLTLGSYEMFVAGVCIGGIPSLVAVIMLLLGVGGALLRWTRQLRRLVSRSQQGHAMIPLIQDSPDLPQSEEVESIK